MADVQVIVDIASFLLWLLVIECVLIFLFFQDLRDIYLIIILLSLVTTEVSAATNYKESLELHGSPELGGYYVELAIGLGDTTDQVVCVFIPSVNINTSQCSLISWWTLEVVTSSLQEQSKLTSL